MVKTFTDTMASRPAQSNAPATPNFSAMANNQYSFRDVCINLALISTVRENEKLTRTDKGLEKDTRYFQWLRRDWSYFGFEGDTKKSTVETIKKIVDSAKFYSEKFIKQLQSEKDSIVLEDSRRDLTDLTTKLSQSIVGLKNLKETYKSNDLINVTIDELIKEINTVIGKNNNFQVSTKTASSV